MSCDVFISYRRIDGTYPTMFLYHDLIEAGYSVFYDIANVRNGKFPELIEKNIISCTDFLLMITNSTFSDRIYDENDWVRKEIRLAIEHNKNIVPIFIGTATIPADLPEDISAISKYNGVFQIDPQSIHDTNKRMFKEFLKAPSDSTNNIRKTKLRCSIYDATYGDEFERLKIQSNNSYVSDMSVINDNIDLKKTYNVLDIGCAYGFVGKTRFENECFENILGIDKNEKCITKAKELNNDPRFDYQVIDIEAEDFENLLLSIMKDKNIESFNVIYSALVIHHLKDPNKFLKRIRKFLSDDGIIIIRGSDDGSKLAYNDDGLMKKIIDLTLKVPFVSDRYNGRKIYSQLKKTGYNNVKLYSYMRDLSSLDYDDRELLFYESFSYRINYVKKEYELDPDNLQKREAFYTMEELLAKLQERFYDSTFWYCEYDYIAVANKK